MAADLMAGGGDLAHPPRQPRRDLAEDEEGGGPPGRGECLQHFRNQPVELLRKLGSPLRTHEPGNKTGVVPLLDVHRERAAKRPGPANDPRHLHHRTSPAARASLPCVLR